ncbi:MAG: hypothetical protein PHQ36_00290 [Anaerolineales bacterium]|nr:hypothetical protein [Anaerolineales bacterium]
MESVSEPKKKTTNIPVIIAVAIIVACCCSAAVLCLITGVGMFSLDWVTSATPPSFDYDFPTEEPGNPVIPTAEAEEPYDPNIPQGGRGNNELRKRVWDFVTSLAEDDADCKNPLPAATIIVVSKEPDGDGVWEEGWTLFCGNGPTPVYRIIFTPNPDGAINFSPGLISK